MPGKKRYSQLGADRLPRDESGYTVALSLANLPILGLGVSQVLNSIYCAQITNKIAEEDGKTWDNLDWQKECWHVLGRTINGEDRFCGRPIVSGKAKCPAHLKL